MSFRHSSIRALTCTVHIVTAYLALSGLPAVQAQTTLSFVSVTPCRVLDTRDATLRAGFGPPTLQAKTSRSFPIPSSSCGIPTTALAYSVNVTAIPQGSLPYLTIWPTGISQPPVSTLNSYGGSVVANAAIVPAGAGGAINIYVDGTTDVILDINGYFTTSPTPTSTTIIQQVAPAVAQSNTGMQSTALGTGASSVGTQNTAVGFNSLILNSRGTSNTASGASALAGNVSGNNNVGLGAFALANNTSGSANTAVGVQALLNNGIANNNTALGFQALWNHNTNGGNTAVGFQAMSSDTGGQNNVALGSNALSNNLTGNDNIAVGNNAGNQITGFSNIDIGNAGVAGESNVVRIGTSGTHQNVYIAGINGALVPSGSQVLVDAAGHLGTFSSSRRYKQDIGDVGNGSEGLMKLRPVQFRYKPETAGGDMPRQYGLIAEEVADVYPELVVRDSQGRADSVQYHELPALLLNELQKERRTIEQQQEQIRSLTARIASLEAAQTIKAH